METPTCPVIDSHVHFAWPISHESLTEVLQKTGADAVCLAALPGCNRLDPTLDILAYKFAHPEFGERYRRIKARRGHKKAIIAVCRMLLTAIWNILSKLTPYSPDGFLSTWPVDKAKALTKSQALELLRLRGYVFTDDPPIITTA